MKNLNFGTFVRKNYRVNQKPQEIYEKWFKQMETNKRSTCCNQFLTLFNFQSNFQQFKPKQTKNNDHKFQHQKKHLKEEKSVQRFLSSSKIQFFSFAGELLGLVGLIFKVCD